MLVTKFNYSNQWNNELFSLLSEFYLNYFREIKVAWLFFLGGGGGGGKSC